MQVRETTVDGRPIRYRVAGGGGAAGRGAPDRARGGGGRGAARSGPRARGVVAMVVAARRSPARATPGPRRAVAALPPTCCGHGRERLAGPLGRCGGNRAGGRRRPFAGRILRGTARCAAAAACAAARTRRTC